MLCCYRNHKKATVYTVYCSIGRNFSLEIILGKNGQLVFQVIKYNASHDCLFVTYYIFVLVLVQSIFHCLFPLSSVEL